ncbi:Type III effector Hrp-dependent outer [Pseudomonas syringae pv. helianthi]|uniref:Type III effector Hrp-dependent outer n=1 Tax=Pseudomonas syringae pv. helianthi TaxID=251654 RepID=A0A0P9RC93_9PSED|nr:MULTISPECIES: four-carbon acid sugar kinase family protein [Pseudomonas syringae group]KPX43312.1 Type III effector Hrp-dependent outer [Pseudomonas syringae pv. helianthi]RMR03211.1 Type III effector Hrp-dependent outer [Pseudomonas syringae pv. helianthi]UNB64899.1 four-carbon acid sugar kinase family protein [Pseudomonas syringae pv. helianthi]
MSRAEFPGLLIIADDLSGAADCAADFASRIDTHVLLADSAAGLSGVIAVDADSRRLAPQQAAEQNRAALQQQPRPGMALYKKIDSTLRGNVASEIDALQGLRGMALVAPAFPAMKRTTVRGVQLVDGVPVDQSDVWRNENLQGTGNLLDLFAAQGLRTQWLGLDTLRDPPRLKTTLRSALEQGVQALVCDAELDSDLLRLAEASVDWHEELFWVGSAGLARHLPHAFGLAEALPVKVQPRSPVLTVVGSMSRHSQVQADRLARISQALCLTLQPTSLLNEDAHAERDAMRLQLREHLSAGEDVLVRLDQQQRDPALAALLSNALAQWLAPALPHAGSLIATGGETARAILTAAGIKRLTLHGELATGVVLAEAQLGKHTINVVTKAGGFGNPDTLLTAWQMLHAPAATGTPFNEEASYV